MKGHTIICLRAGLFPLTAYLALAAAPLSVLSAQQAETADGDELGSLSLVELMQLDPKVTTATRSVALSLEEAPSTMTLITRDEIERYGYRTVGEALASAPGLFVINDFVTANLAVRGIYAGPDSWSRTFKFMIDGKPVQYQATGGALLGPEFVPMTAVESIEIVRGPGSSLYGANAFLGVVNVITKRPSNDGLTAHLAGEAVVVRTKPGMAGSAILSARGGGDKPYWASVAASAARLDRSGLSAPASSPDAEELSGMRSRNDLSQPLSVLARAGWDLRRFGAFEVQSMYQGLDANTPVSEVSAFESETRFAKANFVNRIDYTLPLFKSWALGPGWKQTASVHAWGGATVGRALDREYYATPTGGVHRKRTNTTYDAGAEVTYSLGRNSLLAGADYQNMRDNGEVIVDIDDDGNRTNRNEPTPLKIRNIGFFGQLMFYPLERLGLTGSVRVDDNTKWGNNTTYRAAGVLKVLDQLYLKALYGTSYVPPAPSQLGAVPIALSGGVTGNDDLRRQYASTLEFAALLRPLEGIKANLTVFATKIHDRVENQLVGNRFIAENVTDSDSLGFEVATSWTLGRYTVTGDVAYQHTTLAEPEVVDFRWETAYGEDVAGGSSPPNFPRLLAHMSLVGGFPEAYLGVSLTGSYVGERKSSVANILENGEAYMLAPYFVLGLHVRTIGLELVADRPTVISLHADNLLNADYSHGGAGGVDIPARGIAVFLKMEQGF